MAIQLCPLCQQDAVYEIVHKPYGKRFACPVCTEFFIDQSSEAHIASMPEVTKSEVRKRLSDSAKSSKPDQLFVIREPNRDEITGDGHGSAIEMMIADWVNSKI